MQDFTPVLTVLGMFIANATMIIPLFLWNRSESRADIRRSEELIKAIQKDVKEVQDEMKDFHQRLLKIEESR